MADLTSTARVKRVLGIPAGITLHDEFIGEIADGVDTEILGYTGQAALTLTTLTEFHDIESPGENEIVTRSFPVAGVSYVVSSGSTLSATAYELDNRTGAIRLIASGASFDAGRKSVEVRYTCGFADGSPQRATLAMAASAVAAARFNALRHAGMESEGMGGYRYRLDGDGFPAAARAMLSNFIRVFPRDSSP